MTSNVRKSPIPSSPREQGHRHYSPNVGTRASMNSNDPKSTIKQHQSTTVEKEKSIPSVRFSDDLATQLLLSSTGPGNFLSRSQDNLHTTAAVLAARRRKQMINHNSGTTSSSSPNNSANRRPVSSLGLPKVGSSGSVFPGGHHQSASSKSPRSAATSSSAAQLAQIRKSSLPNHQLSGGNLSSTTSSMMSASVVVPAVTKAKKSGAVSQQVVADARITKTKLTVTELQKQKQELELQVSELVQKAELKQTELATLKMEMRHVKEERDKELENLQRDNERLRSRLLRTAMLGVDEESTTAPITKSMLKDQSTSPTPHESGGGGDEDPILFTTGSGGSSNAEGGEGPSVGVGDPSSTRATADWDRQSTSSMSEVSLANLQDRIVQMEENHYSTNEELQATLQELTDLQDIVNELSKENTQLTEEKSMLLDSLYNQTQKLNNCRLQIENLKHLLLSSTDFRTGVSKSSPNKNANRDGASISARSTSNREDGGDQSNDEEDANSGDPKYNRQRNNSTLDREQQLVDLLKNTHEEHEELALKYDELRSALKTANEEKFERSELAEILRDRARLLENQLETLTAEKKTVDDQVRECKQQIDRDRRELVRLTNAYEKERCRVEELLRETNNFTKAVGNEDELRHLTEKLRSEKAQLEDRANRLEEQSAKRQHEIDDLRHAVENLRADLRTEKLETEKSIGASEERLRELERENEYLKKQSMESRASSMELEERCQRHLDDKKEYRANIITLQKTVDDVSSERERLRRQLAEERGQHEQEQDDWRQFQADLQVAVVVANDFKIEAQNDIERLATENSQLRDRLATLSGELDKLRTNRGAQSPSGKLASAPTAVVSKCGGDRSSPSSGGQQQSNSPDIRTRMEGYLTSVEKSTVGSPTSTTSSVSSTASASAGAGFDSCRSKKYTGAIEPMKGLSVRALVESLESASSPPSAMNFRTTPMLRSPGSNRHSASAAANGSNAGSNGSEMEASMIDAHPLSKSSGHLACRPISVDGVEGLLAKQPIKNAISETEVQTLAPVVSLRGSPMKMSTPQQVPDVVMNAQAAAIDSQSNSNPNQPNNKTPKGILLNRPNPSNSSAARRTGPYLSPDCKDPLGKLMKDAPRGSRRNALLRWCQMKTVGYSGVEITNFSSSWNDGLAFCALLHSVAPERIAYKMLDAKDKRRNFTVAFSTAAELGIPPSLNVDDMLSLERPDWQSVMSYVTAIYKHFEG